MRDERSSWTGLGLAVTDNTGDDEIGVVHDSTKGYSQCIAQLSTFMDCTGGLSIDVATMTSQPARSWKT